MNRPRNRDWPARWSRSSQPCQWTAETHTHTHTHTYTHTHTHTHIHIHTHTFRLCRLLPSIRTSHISECIFFIFKNRFKDTIKNSYRTTRSIAPPNPGEESLSSSHGGEACLVAGIIVLSVCHWLELWKDLDLQQVDVDLPNRTKITERSEETTCGTSLFGFSGYKG